MKIFNSLKDLTISKNTVLTIGTFDGIHPGHIDIISRLVERSKEKGWRNLIVTFHPHPRAVLSNGYKIKLLTTQEEKNHLLKKHGVENLLVINFTKEFASNSAEDFINKYLVDGIGVSEIVIGYDHHFGKDRDGNVELLRKIGSNAGFSVTEVKPKLVDGEVVSSTRIRNAIESGNLQKANKLLGRHYSFSGTVVAGDKRGRELGFPTANIKLLSEEKLLPAIGIYAAVVIIESKKYFGLLSIGKRPTFYDEGEVISEVYIYNFDREIYNCIITIELIERLRGEEKFSSADELIKQMNKDKENGLKILNKLNN
jgi:riboflavin kinase/FMN adenylyltransferase